jgi:hypothetical protein
MYPIFVLALAAATLAGSVQAQAQQISCKSTCRIVCYAFDALDGITTANPVTVIGARGSDRKDQIKRVTSVGLNSFLVTWDDDAVSYYGFPPTVSCRVHNNNNPHAERQ